MDLDWGRADRKTFIPEAYNDIIFAIICEELGIVGAALVILLFAVLIWRGIRIAMNAKDSYGMLVATGITAVIAFQSIINIGVVTNTIPNTGAAAACLSATAVPRLIVFDGRDGWDAAEYFALSQGLGKLKLKQERLFEK